MPRHAMIIGIVVAHYTLIGEPQVDLERLKVRPLFTRVVIIPFSEITEAAIIGQTRTTGLGQILVRTWRLLSTLVQVL